LPQRVSPDGIVVNVEPDAIAVELDFMNPPIAGRRFQGMQDEQRVTQIQQRRFS
jgi:hypothetical protein